MEILKETSDAALSMFKAGYDLAQAQTRKALSKEWKPWQKGILLGCVLLIGMAIGYALASRSEVIYEIDDFDDFEDEDE